MLVIGGQEAETNSVSVRHRDRQDLGTVSLDEFVSTISKEINDRSL
jgi:threonyl-tRNA synthetase